MSLALRRMHPRWRAAAERRERLQRSGGFTPAQISSVKRWYRLAASTAVSGEYESVTEVLGGTAMSQTDADRKPAAATAANGLPVMTLDGTDMMAITLESGNNGTAKWWVLLFVNPADFAATQHVLNCQGVSGANLQRFTIALPGSSGGAPTFDIFVSGFNGAKYTSASALSSGVWNSIYIQYDNSGAAEYDADGDMTTAKLRMALGGTFVALSRSDVGSGGEPAALLSATGTMMLGAANNSDTPTAPLRNGAQLGPNLYFGDEPLTETEFANLLLFEAPT